MEILGELLGAAFLVWFWLLSYSMFLACWRPKLATRHWIMVVHSLGAKFFTIIRWSSLIMLINCSLMAVLNVIRLSLTALRAVAS